MKRKSALYRWVILGCVVLCIPIIATILNYFVNRRLVVNKVEQVNSFMVQNIKYDIDNKMERLVEQAEYYEVNDIFYAHALSITDEYVFRNRILDCYETMKVFYSVNSDMDSIIYIKNKDYLINPSTANTLQYVHRSLVTQGKLDIDLEEWRDELNQGGKNVFFLSDKLSYNACGENRMVYCVPLLYSGTKEEGWIYLSVSMDFMDKIFEEETNQHSTVILLNGENHLMECYGADIEKEQLETLELKTGQPNIHFNVGPVKYIGTYVESDVSDWKYLVCMPENVYMEELNDNRMINFLIIWISVFGSVAAMFLLQKINYRPVQKIMNILSEQGGNERLEQNEFVLVENKIRELYEEKRTMQNSMKKYTQYDKELSLLALIKGKNSLYQRLGEEELLGNNCYGKEYFFVTIESDAQEVTEGKRIEFELLSFLIHNIVAELLGEEFEMLYTVDDETRIYLFIVDRDRKREDYRKFCKEKFVSVNEFFRQRLELELTITIGCVFDSFDQIESSYIEIQEINEQRCYVEPIGVILSEEFEWKDLFLPGRLRYYGKCFEEAVAAVNYEHAQKISREMFEEITSMKCLYNHMMYCVLDIINGILMVTQNMVKNGLIEQMEIEDALANIRKAENMSSLKKEYDNFLKLVCRVIGDENKGSSQISERIKEYVRSNYTDCNVNISVIAEEIGLTPRYMSKLFRDQTGMNLLNYINDERIAHAKILLKSSDYTVEEIAEKSGFLNTRTFRRNFHKATGMTANDYRGK